jgi:hypothetical protein
MIYFCVVRIQFRLRFKVSWSLGISVLELDPVFIVGKGTNRI